jgi:hypothetical protein
VIEVPRAMPLGVAYREWLLGLARVEADAGCPRLFRLKGDVAMYFADVTRDWPTARRHDLMSACVKLICEKNYGYPPIPVSDAEKAADAAFDYPYKLRMRSLGKPGAEIVLSTGQRVVVDADKADAARRWEAATSGALKFKKKALKDGVREAMRGAFGEPEVGGPLWGYTSRVGPLVVRTDLDFGGRAPSQMRYSQLIVQPKGRLNVPLLRHVGICVLLGRPQTEWCYLTDEDIPEATDLLVRLCREFVEAVPGMWERSGLGSETIQES